MYIPPYYKEKDPARIDEFITANSFGLLITGGDEPLATHLPFLMEKNGDERIFLSHMSAANPQVQRLSGGKALVVFQ